MNEEDGDSLLLVREIARMNKALFYFLLPSLSISSDHVIAYMCMCVHMCVDICLIKIIK